MKKYFAVIDSSPKDIAAICARWSKNGDYMIEGYSTVKAEGIEKGKITDPQKAANSIMDAVNALKKKTGKTIHEVYSGVSSSSVEIVNSTGVVLLSKYGREITERDVKKCTEIGSSVKIPLDRESLHTMVKDFSIDGETGIKNPVNLEGVKLEVDVNLLTVNSSFLKNLEKCISHAGLFSDGFIFSDLASSYRTLSPEEKIKGAALIDLNKKHTDVLIFRKGCLENYKSIPFGLDDLPLDEDMRIRVDAARPYLEKISSVGGWDRISKIVVIGDAVHNEGLMEFMEEVFHKTVTCGSCIAQPLEELPPERTAYISTLGMLDYLKEENQKKKHSRSLIKRGVNSVLVFIDKYF